MILRFAEEPADTQFAHTQYAVLNCIVIGSPKPKVTWRLARSKVVVTNVTGLRYVMSNGSLVFPPFSKERLDKSLHQADYQCLAKNELGDIISRAAKLRAVVMIPFSIYAVDHNVMKGNTAVIKAVIPRHVRDYVKVNAWYKGRDGISTGARISVMPSGDLVITNVRPDDAMNDAMYYFTAINRLTGDIQASNPAKLMLIEQRISKSRVTSNVHNLTITAGEIAELQCTAEGYPIPHYAWRKNGVPLIIRDRFKLFAGGSLRIERTASEDKAIYTCEAINSVGSDSVTVHLKVHVPIKFKERPKPQAALMGFGRMEMECDVIGEPKPVVTWYHNAEPVDISRERISIKYNNLVFSTVYGNDIGIYQCVADNGVDMEQRSAEFYVGFTLPKFTTSSGIKVLHPGNPLEISCEVSSTPTPFDVLWYHDGERLGNNQGYVITKIPGHRRYSRLSKLKKSAVSLGDSGEYKCTANNGAGSVEQNITVYVRGGPNITYFLHEVTGVQGQSITLPCRVKGYPLPKITWTKSGRLNALPYDQRQSVARNGTLFIKNVQKGDRGQYKCTAAASNGKKVSITVKVIVMVAPVITPLQWRPVEEGQRAYETCIAAAGDTPLNVTWFKNGRPLNSIPGDLEIMNIGPFGKAISIFKVHERHAGTYTCVVGNRAGIAKDSEQLVVYLGSKFIEDPKDQQVLKQHTAHMTCKTKGYPPARVEWSMFAGGSFVNLNDDPRFSRLLNGTLVIRNVSKNDEGRYSCNAYNGVVGKPVSRQVSLTVLGSPHIVSHSPTIKTQNLQDVNLQCTVTGYAEPDIKWYRGDKEVTVPGCKVTILINKKCEGKKYTIEKIVITPYKRYQGLLKISQATYPDDHGIYRCKAVEKQLGSAEANISVNIQDYGFVKILNSKVELIYAAGIQQIKIECDIFKHYSRPFGVLWFRGDEQISPDTDDRIQVYQADSTEDSYDRFVLYLINTTAEDSGIYACSTPTDRDKNDTIKFTIKPALKPNITSLSNVTANHYSNQQTNIELTCQVTGNPKPIIRWSKKGSTLTSLPKRESCENTVSGYYLKSTSRKTGNVLLICHANHQRRTGLYTCLAQNDKGNDVKTAYINILTAPKIISDDSKSKIVYKNIGQSVHMDCNATGNPSPTVMWTKVLSNGRTVALRGKRKIFSKLKIAQLREDDYGNYICIASNLRGTDKMIASIQAIQANLDKQKNSDSKTTAIVASGIGGTLGLVFLTILLMCCLVNRRQKKLLLEYKAMKYLRSGEDYKLDPNRSILEQCEELPYDADWEFPVKRLILQGVIGSGTFGQVMKAEAVGILSFSASDKKSKAFKRRLKLRRRSMFSHIFQDSAGNDCTRTTVAVKMLKAEANESDYKDLAIELKIMIHLGEHSNIINLFGACTRSEQLMVIMEFAPHGNLLNFLRSRREIYEATWRKTANNPDAEFTLADLVMYSYQIARGMDFLSSKKCVHRDLAVRNVLIGADYVIKIADFGLARDIYKSDLYVKETTGLLPLKWMAPESLFDRVYTLKTDIWSFGIVLWETQTLGGTPYPDIPVKELMDYLAEGQRMRQPKDCPPEIYAIMRDCWLQEPSERPTFSELVRRIERIIEKKISGQEAGDAYISIFMDEGEDQNMYLEPKESFEHSSSNSPRNVGLQSITEEEIQDSPLPPIPCMSLENIHKSAGTDDDDQPIQSPLSPERSSKSTDRVDRNSLARSIPLAVDCDEKRVSGECYTTVEIHDIDIDHQTNASVKDELRETVL